MKHVKSLAIINVQYILTVITVVIKKIIHIDLSFEDWKHFPAWTIASFNSQSQLLQPKKNHTRA